ncbi:MAG: TonB-dependent receptor plug domain-containing protein [Flavisolibacter sp.]
MRKFFAVAAVCISSQLCAQQDSTHFLEEVTLTATKFSTKTTETGKLVTVITRQDIEQAGSRDLAQVITELGGVFINGYTNNAGKEKNIYLRGAKVDYTLITIDGIPVYDASGIGSNFDIRYIPLDNVERIEILKGSQSTLYGSDAIAGVINIITKKGGSKPLSASGSLYYGSYQTYRLNTGINGKKGLLDYNLGFTRFKTDGFSEARKPDTSTAYFDRDGALQNSVEANFGLQAGSKLRLQPFFRYSQQSGSLDQDAFVDEQDFTYTAKNLQTGLQNTLSLGRTQIHLRYQFNRTHRGYLDDSVKSRNGYYTYNQSAYTANEHFAEAFLVRQFPEVKLTAGADFRSSSTSYQAVLVTPAFPPYTTVSTISRPSQSGDSIKQNQAGLYAALNYLHRGFAMETGGRLNHHSEYGSNLAFNLNPSYLVNKKLKVFANLSSGYKTPSLYQLFSEYGNRDLKPESALNMEAGLQYFSKGGKLNIRANYFNRQVKDVIVFFYDPGSFRSRYINQDKQHDHGIEVEARAILTDNIQLKAFYTFVDGQVITRQNGKDTSYFNLLRRPKNMMSLSASFQPVGDLYLNFQVNIVGASRDVYYDAAFQQQDIHLSAYALLNFYAEYALAGKRLKLFADIRNLTDTKYSDIYGYNTAGFNAYGGFRFRL